LTEWIYFDKLETMSKSVAVSTSIVLFAAILLIILAFPVLAQDSSTSATTPGLGDRMNVVSAKRQIAQEKLITRQEDITSKIAATRERVASKAAALKTRLQTFKDQRKATLAEKININLDNINQNRTAQMQRHLDNMSVILDKLASRVNSGRPDIKDPVSAKAAIDTAKTNISTASAAVSAQALKDYTVSITSEGRIGLDVKQQRDALYKDLQVVRKQVTDAKQSVAAAIRIAKSGKEATASGQQ